MKIAVKSDHGTVLYGPESVIAVVLTRKDRENIANMLPEATVYCTFPDDPAPDREAISDWLQTLKDTQ
jgi:hypothetical protein